MTDTKKQIDFTAAEIKPGNHHLPGAHFVNHHLELCNPEHAIGVNFSVFSPNAKAIMLCLFDETGEEKQINMLGPVRGVWSIMVEGIQEHQLYGFRADGRWSPDEGLRFNPAKLLTDPYSKEIKGTVTWKPALFDYTGLHRHEWHRNYEDNASLTPKSVVRGNEFDWQGVTQPNIPESQEVIYELHVKGFTMQHPEIPEHLRGKYLGMCHPVIIDYLKSLGITTVELLPVTSFISEARLQKLNLKNYWGYNPLCFMAPEPSYAIDDPVNELKTMVRELHRAGIKVLMDVVFNHTCEAGSDGASLNLRGLAEKEYYLLDHHHGHMHCANYSGCGNTLNFDTPESVKLLMDSLRYWAEQYQMDGFRFDLAPAMARKHRHFDPASPFFRAVHQDPVLSRCQMIAEPWDLGPEGYRLSGFPKEWQEWNDRCRDGIRAFWRGDADRTVDLAWRMTGSKDVFGVHRPAASINYICSHDGFTLNDLVSYQHRHNLANGEDNRDGDAHNYSINYGHEGPTDDVDINHKRERAKRNMLTTLMMSRSTPMILAGDEFGNTQNGNNNGYCQDNTDVSWLDWSWLASPKETNAGALHQFVSGLIELRKNHPVLSLNYLTDSGRYKSPIQEWFSCSGSVLDGSQLSNELGKCLGIRYRCEDDSHPTLLVMINNSSHPVRFDFPGTNSEQYRWSRILTTKGSNHFDCEVVLNNGWYEVPKRTIVIIEEQDHS